MTLTVPVIVFHTGKEKVEPGTAVDVFGPYDQPAGRWVWITGMRIAHPSQVKASKKHLFSRHYYNPYSGKVEPVFVVLGERRIFPVCKSCVRKSSPFHTDIYIFPRIKAGNKIADALCESEEVEDLLIDD